MKVVQLETGRAIVLKIARKEGFKSIRSFLKVNGFGSSITKEDIERACKAYWAVDDSSFTELNEIGEEKWRDIECCAIIGVTCPRMYFVGARVMVRTKLWGDGVFIPENKFEEIFC